MRLILFVSIGMFAHSIQAQQQQQFSNAMLLNNSNTRVQKVQNNSNRNFVGVATSNIRSGGRNIKVQANKTTSNPSNKTNTVRSNNRGSNTNKVVRQSNKRSNPGGPNSRGNLGNINSNDYNIGNPNDDKIVTNVLDNNPGNSFDNNVGNMSNPQVQVLMNANEQIQTQQAAIPSQSFINETKENKSVNLSLDLSVSRKVISASSSSSSSVKANRRVFQKKYAKVKRNFYGKMFTHKKSRHQVDICFNWK